MTNASRERPRPSHAARIGGLAALALLLLAGATDVPHPAPGGMCGEASGLEVDGGERKLGGGWII